jgi:hypothetical protein
MSTSIAFMLLQILNNLMIFLVGIFIGRLIHLPPNPQINKLDLVIKAILFLSLIAFSLSCIDGTIRRMIPLCY